MSNAVIHDADTFTTTEALRAAGKLLVDLPNRKVALYANSDRQVVLAIFEDGFWAQIPLEQHECSAVRRMFLREEEASAKFWDRCDARKIALKAMNLARGTE